MHSNQTATRGSRDIVKACLANDHHAWNVFVTSFRRVIMKAIEHTLRSYGVDPARDGEDIFQEVLMRLLRKERRLLGTFDPSRSTITTWLAIVSRSTTLDFLRNLESARHISVEEVELASVDPDMREMVLALPDGVLSPRQRTVVTLLFEGDCTVAEVAERLDVHPQTIRSLRHNAFARLRRFYGATSGRSARRVASTPHPLQ